jgi:hypothetical protein
MHVPEDYEIQLDALKRRIWINGPDGSNVARFDNRFGMDIHRSVTEQMNGAPQCLHCTHKKPTVVEWDDFRRKVEHYFGVAVPFYSVDILS